MKIKRKLYPNSNDKEFILCSFNDIVEFSLFTHIALGNFPKNENPVNETEFLENALKSRLFHAYDLKIPASHSKTKKVKEETVNA